MWALGTQCGASERVISILDHQIVSPGPCWYQFLIKKTHFLECREDVRAHSLVIGTEEACCLFCNPWLFLKGVNAKEHKKSHDRCAHMASFKSEGFYQNRAHGDTLRYMGTKNTEYLSVREASTHSLLNTRMIFLK